MDVCKNLSIVVALTLMGAIGKNNRLCWKLLRTHTKRFNELTAGHPVIMGRKNWESIPEKFRPLPGRTNIIMTHKRQYVAEGAIVVGGRGEAYEAANNSPGADEIFVIGGAQIYQQFLPYVTNMYVTTVHANVDGDAHFPEFDAREWSVGQHESEMRDEDNEYDLTFSVYRRVK